MRYVVTGGAGFIGSHLVRRLTGLGHDVLVVDARGPAGAAAAPGVDHVKADVTDGDAMRGAMRGADGVFHLAALVSAPDSIRRPTVYEQVNVGGTRTVLEAADRVGASVVLASSAAVYGDASSRTRTPVAEDAACAPATPYGATKLKCERLLSAGAKGGQSHPPTAVSLRLFNVYGPALSGSSSAGVVARFAARLLSRRPPVISGRGLQVRDFVHVDDVARSFAYAMQLALLPRGAAPARAARRHMVINIGTGRGTSILGLARMMLRIARAEGSNLPSSEFGPATQGDAAYSVSDPTMAASALGWRSAVDMTDGLRGLLSAPRD